MNTLLTIGSAFLFAASASKTIYWEMSVQALEAVAQQRSHEMQPILGPITTGGAARALDFPSDDEILRVLGKIPRYKRIAGRLEKDETQVIRIVKEKFADYVDAPRVYPLIGKAQIHHAKYRCTIEFYDGKPADTSQAADSKLSQTIVIFVDHNHFHMLPVTENEAIN